MTDQDKKVIDMFAAKARLEEKEGEEEAARYKPEHEEFLALMDKDTHTISSFFDDTVQKLYKQLLQEDHQIQKDFPDKNVAGTYVTDLAIYPEPISLGLMTLISDSYRQALEKTEPKKFKTFIQQIPTEWDNLDKRIQTLRFQEYFAACLIGETERYKTLRNEFISRFDDMTVTPVIVPLENQTYLPGIKLDVSFENGKSITERLGAYLHQNGLARPHPVPN